MGPLVQLGPGPAGSGTWTSLPGHLGPRDHKGKRGAQGPSQREERKRGAKENAEAPGKEGKHMNIRRPRSRTGTAAHRQACPAAQVLLSPVGLCHGRTAGQREASATWN